MRDGKWEVSQGLNKRREGGSGWLVHLVGTHELCPILLTRPLVKLQTCDDALNFIRLIGVSQNTRLQRRPKVSNFIR